MLAQLGQNGTEDPLLGYSIYDVKKTENKSFERKLERHGVLFDFTVLKKWFEGNAI